MLLISLLLLGVFVALLVTSAKLVESSFSRIASKFRINEFILGFFVLAIITSLPEISIALASSHVVPELSLGNLIGATIVLLTLVLGISAIKYKGIEFKGKFSEKEVLIGIITILLMVAVVLDGYLSIFDGLILLGAYSAFIYYLYKRFSGAEKTNLFVDLDNSKPIKYFLLGLVGAVGIIVSSFYVVQTSVDIAEMLGISNTLIGILLLAVGTNLPEITILLTSKKDGEVDLAIGGLFGSACVNVAILGLLALTSGGFSVEDMLSLASGLVLLVFSSILLLFLSWTGKKLTRAEGFLLVAAYIAFVTTEIIIIAS
jgi:cation:H+ antiporter